MNTKKYRAYLLATAIILPGLFGSLHAQEAQRSVLQDFRYGAGIRLGTDGITIDGGVNFMPEVSVRAGLSFLPSFHRTLERQTMAAEINNVSRELYADTDVKSSFITGHLLADYHPFKNGFRVTAGLYFGSPKVNIHFALTDKQTGKPITMPGQEVPSVKLEINDQNDKPVSGSPVEIKIADDSTLDLSATYRNLVQPYIGIGYGYAVPNSRVGFTADLGMLYTGGLTIKSPNIISGNFDGVWQTRPEMKVIKNISTFLPVLSIGMSIRIY